MKYLIELKQLVKFPRCRIYREFIRELMKNRDLHTSGGSGLFYYMVLCSYVNFCPSSTVVGATRYIVEPGEWVCRLSEIATWFRQRFHRQALSILRDLQAAHLIEYSLLAKGTVIKYKILEWEKSNKILDRNAPCQKDRGFYFFPVSKAQELVSRGRCSEMDIVLDLWLHAIYNDPQVLASDVGPVVYMRNGTGNPSTTCRELADRWSVSKSTVSRILNKMRRLGILEVISMPGRLGTILYLKSYLSVMFNVSDTTVDKSEVAMCLKVHVDVPIQEVPQLQTGASAPDNRTENFIVSGEISCVPKSHIQVIAQKITQIIAAQGLPCPSCMESKILLSELSDCGEGKLRLEVICGRDGAAYEFELTLLGPVDHQTSVGSREGRSHE